MYQIKHNDRIIKFSVEYRKRKSLAIQIIASNDIRVLVPKTISKQQILDLVESKANWIVAKLDIISKREQLAVPKQFVNGELFHYLGREYKLVITLTKQTKQPEVILKSSEIHIIASSTTETDIKAILIQWYKEQAMKLLAERVALYGKTIGVQPTKIRLSNAQKRWGSCSSKGSLLINWRLVMAPLEVFDYVVVHELCHLVHLNHSKDYWNLVRSIIPNYQQRKEWLKDNGMALMVFD